MMSHRDAPLVFGSDAPRPVLMMFERQRSGCGVLMMYFTDGRQSGRYCRADRDPLGTGSLL